MKKQNKQGVILSAFRERCFFDDRFGTGVGCFDVRFKQFKICLWLCHYSADVLVRDSVVKKIKTKIYHYTYKQLFPFKVYVSPLMETLLIKPLFTVKFTLLMMRSLI